MTPRLTIKFAVRIFGFVLEISNSVAVSTEMWIAVYCKYLYHLAQNFRWIKILLNAHALYWHKNFAELNFAHSASCSLESSGWSSRMNTPRLNIWYRIRTRGTIDLRRCGKAMETQEIECCIRGYHVYQDIWEAAVDEELVRRPERSNAHDRYAVAVMKNDLVVGHLPSKFSRLYTLFMRRWCHSMPRDRQKVILQWLTTRTRDTMCIASEGII